jgi:hypothetical protein
MERLKGYLWRCPKCATRHTVMLTDPPPKEAVWVTCMQRSCPWFEKRLFRRTR